MRLVVQHMASLAQCTQIGEAVVRGIVVQMGTCQQHTGLAKAEQSRAIGYCGRPTTALPPMPGLSIKPTSVGQALDHPPMRTTALLAVSTGTGEADPAANLDPIDGIVPAQGRADGHGPRLVHRTRQVHSFFHHSCGFNTAAGDAGLTTFSKRKAEATALSPHNHARSRMAPDPPSQACSYRPATAIRCRLRIPAT